MTTPTAWGDVQGVASHLERAISKELGALLLLGGGLLPEGRTLLKEGGDLVQTAHAEVEALVVKGKKRKDARAAVLKALAAAERQGVAAAQLLFREKVPARDVVAASQAVAEAIRHELEALNALLALRGTTSPAV
jgi:hypothetical protein